MKAAIIGGDKRMLYAARAFIDAGYAVSLWGFSAVFRRQLPLAAALDGADFVVLPVPCVRGGALNAPYADEEILLDRLMEEIGQRRVFCGIKPPSLNSTRVYDYAVHPRFLCRNATLTAEGAIGEIIRLYEGAIRDARILVAGFGRIGEALSTELRSMGAAVTVAARSVTAREHAGMLGIEACDFSFRENKQYDILVNTVPAPVFTEKSLDRLGSLSLVIDLASPPGGVDFDYLKNRDIPAVHALSLPGRCAPKTAGEIIKETVEIIMQEENLG